MKHLFSYAICLFILLSCTVLVGQQTRAHVYTAAINDLRDGILKLESKLKASLDSDYERKIRAQIAIDVAQQFVGFARWDQANPEKLAGAIGEWKSTRQYAEEFASELPVKEIRDCLAILDDASRQLNESSNWPKRKTNFQANLSKAKIVDGFYFNDGQPMFPFGVFRGPDDVPSTFGSLSFAYIHPKNLNRKRPRIGGGQLDWLLGQLNEKQKNLKDVYLFLGHEPPSWETGNAVRRGRTTFVEYNIDHPVIESWWKDLLAGFGRTYFDHESTTDIAMLANEPHWFSTETNWGAARVSSETLVKFQLWLKRKHDSIDKLNSKWKTRYKRFADIKFQTPLPAGKLQGTGFWFDWCSFNMSRAMSFFKTLDTAVRRENPNVLSSLKIPSQLFLETQHDHGIDWFRIANEFGMLGIDSTLEASSGIHADENTISSIEYSVDWVGSTAALDFLKSTCPNKMVFDSEWHGVSNIHWRDPDLPSEYVRTCLWLNHLSGMAMNQMWYWSRDQNGAPSAMNIDEFCGSVLTQPKALNAYLTTMAELNQFAAEVVDVVRSKKTIGLLYCEEAAIQDPSYLDQFSEVYQALKFTGLPIRIVSVQAVAERPANFSNNQKLPNPLAALEALIVPPTRFLSDSNLSALDGALAPSLNIIGIGCDNFLLDAYGAKRTGDEFSLVGHSKSVSWAGLRQLHKALCRELSESIKSSSVVVDANGLPIWGLLQFQQQAGPMKVFVNVLKHDIDFRLGEQNITLRPMETEVVLVGDD